MPDSSFPVPGNLARRILRGAAYLGTAQYASMGIGLIKTMILARLVAPEHWGVLGLALVWVSFLNVFRMELREVVISDQNGHPARLFIQYVFENATSLIGAALGAGVYLIAPWLAQPEVWTAIFVLLGVRLFTSLTSTPVYMLHRDIRQDVLMRLTLIGTALAAVVSVATAFLGRPLLTVLLDTAIPVVALGAGAWVAVGWRPRALWDGVHARDIFRFGTTLWTGGLLGKITWEFDDWLVGKLWSAKALGYYGKAYWLAKLPMDVFAGVIGGIALSMYAQSRAEGEAVLARVYRLTTWLLTRVVALAGIVMLAAADELVAIVLGPKWGPVPLLLRVMFLYVLARPLYQNNAQLLISVRKEKQFVATLYVQAALLLVLGPPLVYLWGGVGASIAVNIMQVAGFVWSQAAVSRCLGKSGPGLYALPALTLALAVPFAYAIGQFAGDGILISLIVKAGLGALLFGAVILLLERGQLKEVAGPIRTYLLQQRKHDETAA
jgi:O-antigen/teichoic acid export membrane protein